MSSILQAQGLCAGYGAQPVINDLDIVVNPGEVVALLGPNGAGKTTTLLALSGELPVMGGQVLIAGTATKAPLHKRARAGLAFVPAERSIFKTLTARDNFRAANVNVDQALQLFPELHPRLDVRAGLLSGGEQQMLILARALARRPRLLLADELSLGLAPLIVRRLLEAVRDQADHHNTGVLLVEQHVRKALHYTDRGYVMRRGRIILQGTQTELRGRLAEIEDTYLATSEEALT